MEKKFYFVGSTKKNDKINLLTVFTSSARRAIAMAQIRFIENNCKGYPILI